VAGRSLNASGYESISFRKVNKGLERHKKDAVSGRELRNRLLDKSYKSQREG